MGRKFGSLWFSDERCLIKVEKLLLTLSNLLLEIGAEFGQVKSSNLVQEEREKSILVFNSLGNTEQRVVVDSSPQCYSALFKFFSLAVLLRRLKIPFKQ